MIEKVNIAERLARIDDYWKPRIVAAVNTAHVKLVKLRGEFVWHSHENEDEMFLVISGTLVMRLRDRDVRVEPGEFIVIPRGVEHLPTADNEVAVMLFEPATTLNTGNVRNERTIETLERI